MNIFITGASRGIGRAIAIEFAKKGHTIFINCLSNKNQLDIVKKEVISYGASCYSFIGDIGDEEQANCIFRKILEIVDGIDILINNAGISYIGLLTDMDILEWNRIIQTNLTSVFCCCKLAIPSMIHKKKGKIINISSVWGEVGASCEVAYSATKGAVNGFTKALAKELAPSNIQVNAVACGIIDTEMNECFIEEEKQAILEEIPAGRFGKTRDVAEFVLQLSEANSYFTGQIIKLDGAWK